MSTSFSVQRVGNLTIFAIIIAVILNTSLIFWLITQLQNNQAQAAVISLSSDKAQQTQYHVAQIQQFLTDVSATGERDGFKDAEEHYQDTQKLLSELTTLQPESKAIFDMTKNKLTQFYEVGTAMAENYLAEGRKSGNALMKQSQNGFDDRAADLVLSINHYMLPISEQKQSLTAELTKKTARFKMLITLLNILFAVAFVFSRVRFNRRLIRMLGGEPSLAQEVTDKIANGNLNITVPVNAGDNSSLLASMHKMQQNLNSLIWQIKASAEEINAGAHQIAMGNADLSQRTEDHASCLEETASSMEQIASTAKQNADNAKQANAMASEASAVALKGGEVVEQVVHTMTDIKDSSKKIVDIISVIDGIAFQTNILALNAAVEAARAGQQGRGFAVVASEVRSLALRSATAAKEIKQLIDDSVSKVNSGAQQVHAAGETMHKIVNSVKKVTDIVNEIAAASIEQSAGIDQVNKAITNMDEGTQQNAALVEQAAAASESMESNAQDLAASVRQFKLEALNTNLPSLFKPQTSSLKAVQLIKRKV